MIMSIRMRIDRKDGKIQDYDNLQKKNTINLVHSNKTTKEVVKTKTIKIMSRITESKIIPSSI